MTKGQLLVRVPARATMSAASAAECGIAGPAAGSLNDWQVSRPHELSVSAVLGGSAHSFTHGSVCDALVITSASAITDCWRVAQE